MLAMAVMENFNHNTIPIDQLMQMQRGNCRSRSIELVSKIKTEFRRPTREQCQYWIVGPNPHTGDQETGIKPPGRRDVRNVSQEN
jgi:hypothetical protein